MYKYLLAQEQYLLDAMKKGDHLEALYEYSKVQIAWISHERLVHLLVTLFVSLLSITSFIGFMILGNVSIGIVVAILFILVLFYIVHYYRLENGVQGLYNISNQIHHKMGL